MSSPASVAKHPIHPMLVPFPIALLIFSLVCDLAYAFTWEARCGKTWHSSRWLAE